MPKKTSKPSETTRVTRGSAVTQKANSKTVSKTSNSAGTRSNAKSTPKTKKRPASPTQASNHASKKSKATANPTLKKICYNKARVPPAHIPSGDEDDADGEDDAPSPDEDRRHRGDSEAEEDENDDDLAGRDPEEVEDVLSRERPRWRSHSTPAADALFDSNDNVYTTRRSDIDFTSASEFDNNFGDDEVGDNDNVDDDDVSSAPVAKKISKRASDRQKEVPTWDLEDDSDGERNSGKVNAESDAGSEGGESAESDDGSSSLSDLTVNQGWPDAQYYLPSRGQRTLQVKKQPSALQMIIRASIRQTTGDAIFVTAYQSITVQEEYLRKSIAMTAGSLELKGYEKRILMDNDFAQLVISVLAVRVCNLRSGIKKMALPKVEGFYQLLPGDRARERVKKLTSTMDYIYPRSEEGVVVATQPYRHPAIISTLQEYFFSSTRRSLADKHVTRFKVSYSGWDVTNEDELEIPAPMLCMVATAIHAALDDWSTGVLKKSDFNADAYEDPYRGHAMFLDNIRSAKPGAYHRLMADLYNDVSSRNTHSAHKVATGAMAILDLEGMAV